MLSSPEPVLRLSCWTRIRFCSLLVLTLASISIVRSQTTEGVVALELGEKEEHELVGSKEHSFDLALTKGQYAKLDVTQRGIDAIVQLLSSDGKPVIDFDNELRPDGPETVEFVAATDGNHRLLIKAKYPLLPPGRFEVQVKEIRSAKENELLLDEARRLRTKAWQMRMGDKYAEALPVAEKALEIQERVLGTEHPDLVFTLGILAVISEFKLDYSRAEAFYLRGQELAEKTLGPQHLMLGRLYSSAAYFYFRHRGDYGQAEAMYKRGLLIREGVLGPDHPEVAKSVRDLGFLSLDLGDYVGAEGYLRRATAISEKAFGTEHVETTLSVMYLAGVYMDKGDYAKSEELFLRALGNLERSFGAASGWAAIGIKNLASLYLTMEEYDKAEPLFLRALSIDEKGNPPDHPDILRMRHQLSELYLRKREFAKLDSISKGLLDAIEKRLGPKHDLAGLHRYVIGRAFFARNDLENAETHLRRAIEIVEAATGPNYHALSPMLLDLASVAAKRGRTAEAVQLVERSNAIHEYNLNINLATGSERQKLAYLNILPDRLNQAIAIAPNLDQSDARTREMIATSILHRKGRVQDALSQSIASLRERLSAEDRTVLDRLNTVTARLARLSLDGPGSATLGEYQQRIRAAENERETLESEVSRLSFGFYNAGKVIDLRDVQKAIPPKAVLVEFSLYDRPNSKDDAGPNESRYIAYVLGPTGSVRLKDLGPAAKINESVLALRQALRDPLSRNDKEVSRALDAAVMRPIREFLGEAKELLIAPDGELNLIPFEAFVDQTGRYLTEDYSITYLTTGRELVRPNARLLTETRTTIVANPVFGEQGPDGFASRLSISGSRRRSITNTRNLSDTYFAPLGGTAREAASIKTLFPNAELLTGPAATETAVKQLSTPNVLHIATHGFFLEDENPETTSESRNATVRKPKIGNPLLRSGLALAGANIRKGENDDGILTALEATGLNLWGTKLVVLSACDTGVGEVRNGEGVYGLRRSFVIAGAESLVMSLWPVSDQVTRELMTGYYKNLKNGLGRGEALRQVRLEMLKKPGRKHPFYWASFIQSGEWANLDGKR